MPLTGSGRAAGKVETQEPLRQWQRPVEVECLAEIGEEVVEFSLVSWRLFDPTPRRQLGIESVVLCDLGKPALARSEFS